MRPLQFLRDLSVTRKLSAAFLILVALALIAGWVTIDRLAAINATTVEMRSNWLIGMNTLGEADNLITDERRLVNAHILSESSFDKARFDAQIKAGRAQFDSVWGSYVPTATQADEIRLLDDFRKNYDTYLRLVNAVLEQSRSEEHTQARAMLLATAGPAQEAARSALRELMAYNQRGAANTVAMAAELFDSGWKFIVALVLMFALVSAGLVWLMRHLLLQPILNLTGLLEALAAGRTDVQITERDRADEIGRMARGLLALQATVMAQESTAWIKSHSTHIVTSLQGLDTLPEFARQLMRVLTPAVGAQVGVFYNHDKNSHRFTHVGSYGYKHRKGLVQHFALGEGIVGQCALERAPITLAQVPSDYLSIASGLGAATPRFVLALPVIASDGRILAVVELASLARLNNQQQGLINEVFPMISLNIDILDRNQRTRELLASK